MLPLRTVSRPTTGSMAVKKKSPVNQQRGSAQNEAPGGLTAQSSICNDSSPSVREPSMTVR
jgi:hypothetical protein